MGNNFAIPYSSYINGGLQDGMELILQATAKPNADRFSINFCSGPSVDHGDVCFHFNPRFNQGLQGTVVRNHRHGNNMWGAEETSGGFPLRKGQYFSLQVQVRNQSFKIVVNGQHFCDFKCRLSLASVQYLFINGDITVHTLKEERPAQYPGGQPAAVYPHGSALQPIYNPAVPAVVPIQGGFYPGKIIHLSGVPHMGGIRFHVELMCGYNPTSSDIAFHFDVRFNFGSDRNVVVRAHRQNGQWGREEKQAPYFPFIQNVVFEMMLLCEPQSVKVAVNNQHFIEFNHRLQPLGRVDHVRINGDVTIHQIRFQ